MRKIVPQRPNEEVVVADFRPFVPGQQMRFGFRSLIVATILFSLAVWVVCWFTADSRERERVVADLRSLGASSVTFENLDGSPTLAYETPDGWKSARLTEDWTLESAHWFDRGDVTMLGFRGPIVSDGLARYPTVTHVYFEDVKDVDGSIDRLRVLPRLESVNLSGTDLTDAGVERLAMLDSLQTLHLNETQVTDACLDDLAKLPNLLMLRVRGTRVTATGMARLRELRPDMGVWDR